MSISKKLVTDVSFKDEKNFFCTSLWLWKATKLPFKIDDSKPVSNFQVGERIFTDVCGPVVFCHVYRRLLWLSHGLFS